MLLTLIRAQLLGIFAALSRSKKGKRTTAAGAAALILLLAVLFIFMFGVMFKSLALPFAQAGLDWFYFAFSALAAFALGFIGSVFMAQQQLFAARDNELLLSMPIRPRDILGARMIALLIMDYALTLVVLIPAFAVWLMDVGGTAAGAVGFIVGVLLLPLLIMAFTCLFAWLLALLSSRMRHKTVITVALYLVFLAAYFYFYFNIQDLLAALIANSGKIAGAFAAVYPLYAFGRAAMGDLAQLAGFAACCILPFAAVYAILSRGFLAVTTRRPAVKKAVYHRRSVRERSVSSALLHKELARFSANGMYILNAAMGSILTVGAAALLLVYRESVTTVLSMLRPGWTAALVSGALCFLSASDVISAPSISLEGKALWIVKSLPVPARTVLMSKVELHLVISLPTTVLAAICCVIALPMTAAEIVAVFLLPVLMTFFCALLGVVANLRFPRFDYINETAVVKQSISVMLSMFGSWAVIVLLCIVCAVLGGVVSIIACLYICAAVLAAACAAMYVYLGRGGTRRFENL